MVSERTLISIPLKGSAALMNHSISAICSDFESAEGWNSLLIQRSASGFPAIAVKTLIVSANAALMKSLLNFIIFLLLVVPAL